ncbi:MAG: hypothetical protein QME77_14195 [bacterium]|nr:hypothetical protein [bacterium]
MPAKRVPEFVREIVAFYREHRLDGEEFNRFVDRVSTKPFEELAAKYREVPPLSAETLQTYMDWGKSVAFKVERGEGECST